MSDLETQLRAYADHVDTEVDARVETRMSAAAEATSVALDESDRLDEVPDRVRPPWRPNRRLIAFASIAAGIVAVAAVGVWWSSTDDPSEVDVIDSSPEPSPQTTPSPDGPTDLDAAPPTPTSADPAADVVDAAAPASAPVTMTVEPADPSLVDGEGLLDPGPLSPRHDVLLLRTPGEMIVWGGDVEAFNIGRPDLETAQFADGAILDLATGEWRVMAPGPLPAVDENPFGVWIDDRAFLSRGGVAALYDPATDTWQTIPEPPGAFRPVLAMPERSEVLAAGDQGHAVYSLETGEWRVADDRGPAPNLASWDRSLDWTGEVVIAATMPDIFGGRLVVETWDPATDTGFTEVSEFDLGFGEQAFDAAWLDGELVVVGYDMNVAAYDPLGDTWRRMTDLPVRFQEGVPEIHGLVEGELIVQRWPGLGVLGGDGAWRVSPASRGTQGVMAAGLDGAPAIWSFRVGDGDENEFRVLPVATLASARSVLVGFVILDLADGESLVEMALNREFFGDEAPTATLALEGGTCTLTELGFDPTTAPGDAAEAAAQVEGRWIDLVCDPGVDRSALLARLRPFRIP